MITANRWSNSDRDTNLELFVVVGSKQKILSLFLVLGGLRLFGKNYDW